jgi:hypothetical protein
MGFVYFHYKRPILKHVFSFARLDVIVHKHHIINGEILIKMDLNNTLKFTAELSLHNFQLLRNLFVKIVDLDVELMALL